MCFLVNRPSLQDAPEVLYVGAPDVALGHPPELVPVPGRADHLGAAERQHSTCERATTE